MINLAVKMSISFWACQNKHNFKSYLQQNVDNVKIHILLQTNFLKTDMWEHQENVTPLFHAFQAFFMLFDTYF